MHGETVKFVLETSLRDMWMFSGLGYNRNPQCFLTVVSFECVIHGDFYIMHLPRGKE